MRIWYQSYVDYENGKTYWDRLRKHLEAVVDPGTTVDIKGITPHDSYAHALVEMRCAREVICNAVRAEREGYDAFVIGHFQDAGLYEARSAVGIPVVALGEASMLYGCQLGQRSGIVTINTRYIPWFHHQITKYGLERRVTGVHAMQFEPGQILKAYESQDLADEVARLFAEQARPLVASGVDVLIPGRRDSHAVVLGHSRACRRWGARHQRHSDRRQDGGNGRETAAARGPRRKPRLRLRPAADRDPGGVPDPSQGTIRRRSPGAFSFVIEYAANLCSTFC